MVITQTHLTALCPGLPGWAGTRKVKPIWILLKQETVSGSGISWAVCKSAPRSRQITMPAPHQSVFYRPDALPAAQPTASKHWRQYEMDITAASENQTLANFQFREKVTQAKSALCRHCRLTASQTFADILQFQWKRHEENVYKNAVWYHKLYHYSHDKLASFHVRWSAFLRHRLLTGCWYRLPRLFQLVRRPRFALESFHLPCLKLTKIHLLHVNSSELTAKSVVGHILLLLWLQCTNKCSYSSVKDDHTGKCRQHWRICLSTKRFIMQNKYLQQWLRFIHL